MNFRYIPSLARSLVLIAFRFVVLCLAPIEAAFTAVLQTSPTMAALMFLKEPKPAAMRVIAMLKPVYRDSYRTDGRSLDYRRFAT